jgi:hypothetical protein
MQQKLTAQTAEKYLSGVAQNAGSSEETTAVQNADSLDHSESLEDPLLPLPKQNEIFVCADVFEASFCMHACTH